MWKSRVCGAKFPTRTVNIAARCHLPKRHDGAHEVDTARVFARWTVRNGTVDVSEMVTR